MARLLVEATRHPAITNIWGLPTHTLTIDGPNARELQIRSSVNIAGQPGILGGKTGSILHWTHNLAIHARTGSGAQLVAVVMGCPSNDARTEDIWTLLRAFEHV
jgi:D-alanyl-D-alanine carboxypeptidase